jgi:hypothetical protein
LKTLLAREDDSRDRSPASNVQKALPARKEQFEGPKSFLEYLEGAVGPRRRFEYNFDPKNSLEGAKDRVVEKLCVYSDDTKERSKKDLEENPVERPSECKRYVPSRLERTFANLCPLSRKESTYPKKRIIADDTPRRVVTSSSAGMA